MIGNKKESYNLYEKGLFGNKLRTWDSIKEFNDSGYNKPVTIRYKKQDAKFCAYNVTDVDEKIKEFIAQGADSNLFVFNESAPDEKLLIQGEIQITHRGYNLFYSLEKGKMRDCLKNGVQVYGLKAKLILEKYLYPASLEDIKELLELYQNHILEFGAYNMTLGSCKNRNTIIWEVRAY